MHSDRFGCLHSYMSQHKCIASSKKKICTHKNTSSQLTTDLKKKKDERWHSSFFHCNEPLRLIAFIRLRNFQLTSPQKKRIYTQSDFLLTRLRGSLRSAASVQDPSSDTGLEFQLKLRLGAALIQLLPKGGRIPNRSGHKQTEMCPPTARHAAISTGQHAQNQGGLNKGVFTHTYCRKRRVCSTLGYKVLVHLELTPLVSIQERGTE